MARYAHRNMRHMVNLEKGRSPFSPGRPVGAEMFVGRRAQIDRMLRSARQVALGKQENLFVTGEYGIGKSSLVSLVRATAEQEHGVAGFHVLLGGVASVEAMVQHVVSRIIQQAHANRAWEKVKALLGKYVESVQLFSVKINLGVLKRDAPEIAQDFLPFLRRLWSTLEQDYQGMALFLDDLNGISPCPQFAALIKSTVDEIATSGQALPLLLALAGVPQRRVDIITNQPPVKRIFDVVELEPLSDAEVRQFYIQAFESVNMSVQRDALQVLVRYCGGLPELMHELGDAVFWTDADGRVDEDDAFAGVVVAADRVGKKYFEAVSRALKSTDYRSILMKLGALPISLSFTTRELSEGLSDAERRKLNNFLQRMKKLRALSPGEARGEWVFPNLLLRLYLYMESRGIARRPSAS